VSYSDHCKEEPKNCEPSKPEPFKIEAVIVCDQYHDFLAETLATNRALFDKLVVVTSHEDKKTQRICEWNHVQVIPTDVLETRKKKLCKGKGINVGLAALDKTGWVLHMDADMWLPPQTRNILENADLDPSMIYGIDRYMVKGRKAWDRFKAMPDLQHEDQVWVHPNSFPLGTRVTDRLAYTPIGFWQLWNPRVSGVYEYLEGHVTAGREDYLFGLKWPRARRGFLPELLGYHLESADSKGEMNWEGRKSLPFTREAEEQ
jgi:hypothetical protein